MILSDQEIIDEITSGHLSIEPFDEAMVQPASIDLLLGKEFKVFKNTHQAYIDVKKPVTDYMEKIIIEGDTPLIVHPREFLLGHTVEFIKFPNNIVGRLEGKSSLARLGLIVHVTAGFFDPGFEGQPTLEITNLSNLPIAIYPGMKICQMSFHLMSKPASKPYGSNGLNSKYKGQTGATGSQMHQNF